MTTTISIDAQPILRLRRPIERTDIDAAIAKSRSNWPTWSPGHRCQFRWDVEAALDAECQHVLPDFNRVANRLHLCEHFADYVHPEQAFRLPREVLAGAALNALRHASIASKMVRDVLNRIPDQRRAARDMSQSMDYRENWTQALNRSAAELGTRWRERRRAWTRALQLIGDYQKEIASCRT